MPSIARSSGRDVIRTDAGEASIMATLCVISSQGSRRGLRGGALEGVPGPGDGDAIAIAIGRTPTVSLAACRVGPGSVNIALVVETRSFADLLMRQVYSPARPNADFSDGRPCPRVPRTSRLGHVGAAEAVLPTGRNSRSTSRTKRHRRLVDLRDRKGLSSLSRVFGSGRNVCTMQVPRSER